MFLQADSSYVGRKQLLKVKMLSNWAWRRYTVVFQGFIRPQESFFFTEVHGGSKKAQHLAWRVVFVAAVDSTPKKTKNATVPFFSAVTGDLFSIKLWPAYVRVDESIKRDYVACVHRHI